MANDLSLVESGITIIKQVGFPIFVAGWFMLRTDWRLEAATKALNDLREEFRSRKH